MSDGGLHEQISINECRMGGIYVLPKCTLAGDLAEEHSNNNGHKMFSDW